MRPRIHPLTSAAVTLLVAAASGGCSPRIAPAGPGATTIAYAEHGNGAQRFVGTVGGGIAEAAAYPLFVALMPIVLHNGASGRYELHIFRDSLVRAGSQATGAIVWPFFGWWEVDQDAGGTTERPHRP